MRCEICKISEICERIVSGGTPSSREALYYNGSIPWLNTKEINFNHIFSTQKTITEAGFANSATKWVPKHSVIVAMYGATAARVAYSEIDLTTNQACCNLIIDTSKVESLYVYYYLSNVYHELHNLATGAAQQNLSVQVIGDFPIILPPLEEQKRIVSILSVLDDKIELSRRINENLEQQAQALFKHWFVDFEFPNEDGKPYKSSGGKFVKSELGNIPKDWKVVNYTDIISVKSGGTPKTNVVEYWGGDIPFFSPKDVPYSCYVLKTEKSVTKAGLDNCNSALYPKNTVFITARGTVGKVVLAGRDMAMNQTNYALIGKDGICQYYVYHITLQLVERLRKKANGAVFSAITTRDFASERIVVPCNHVIDFFKDRVRPIYKHILLNNIENERLSAIRDTLLPRLMNGEFV